MRIFKALFKVVSTRFGLLTVENSIKNPHFIFFVLSSKKDDIRISKGALFKGVSTRFGLRIVEKSVEYPDCIFCSSFPNLRLERMKLLLCYYRLLLSMFLIPLSTDG